MKDDGVLENLVANFHIFIIESEIKTSTYWFFGIGVSVCSLAFGLIFTELHFLTPVGLWFSGLLFLLIGFIKSNENMKIRRQRIKDMLDKHKEYTEELDKYRAMMK